MGFIEHLKSHPALTGAAAGVFVGASTVGITNLITSGVQKARAKRKKTTSKKRTSTTRKKRTTKSRTRKSTGRGSKKIYKTKNGQPYIKLASGKARFISKKSAQLRRKRKGGYY